ncbi:MAG TPA: potassium/proton antiporter [Bacteroidales bacterium]|nr:potassium/proton antiporter [Bacteroidales bacterium]HNR41261.1 potassium/proton antiporter [Bacteroidales bacterium]HPM17356.1 potassium/proton antiporter [Bacteroidales bacterium]HQG78053.1 potassium/proton antiporter [Bacteroidales bacterium]
MKITFENILLIGSVLFLISIIAGKTSFRLGIPTLIFFLIIGMLAGTDGIGKIEFNNPSIAQFIGIVALNFILFSGGFETDWKSVKPVFGMSFSLSILGVILTAVFLGIFTWLVTDFTLFEGLLLGSIVSSTDAAAVFSILRSKNVALKGHIRPMLEFESGSNDPMAYILTIMFLGMITGEVSSFSLGIKLFLMQLLIGGGCGFLFGYLSKQVINKIKLDYDGLYPVLSITLMFLTYSLTNLAGGNGFLAVYLSALYLGNQNLLHKRTIMKMFDGLAWLMQIVLFLALGMLVFPTHILPVVGVGLAISAFLMIVARPLACFICLAPFKIKTRVKWFISFVGLRGAVPIVFATFPLMAGIDKAGMIFNIVFFISLSSVLIQGTSIPRVAKWLHVDLPVNVKSVTPADVLLAESLNSQMVELTIASGFMAVGKKIVDLHFPPNVRISLIKKKGIYVIPDGNTVIDSGDVLFIIGTNREALDSVTEMISERRA